MSFDPNAKECILQQFVFIAMISHIEVNSLSVDGTWNVHNSSGCIKYSTWRDNPQYCLSYEGQGTVTISLCSQSDHHSVASIGFYVYNFDDGTQRRIRQIREDKVISKGGPKLAQTGMRMLNTSSLSSSMESNKKAP